MRKKVNLSRKYKEAGLLKRLFGSEEKPKDSKSKVATSDFNFTSDDYDKLLYKTKIKIEEAITNKSFGEIPLIFYNSYAIVKYDLNSLNKNRGIDGATPREKVSHSVSQISQFFVEEFKEQEKNKFYSNYGDELGRYLQRIFMTIHYLIEDEEITLGKTYTAEDLYSLINSHEDKKYASNYLKQAINYLDSNGNKDKISILENYLEIFGVDSSLDESYLYSLFEDENESLPIEEPSIRPKTADKLSDEDIDILSDELTTPSPSQEPEGVSSSSMGIEDVLKNIAQWKNDFEKSPVLDSFIAGADIVENETERTSFQFLTDSQYSDFSKLIDSARDIATLINDLSYDAEKLLGEIELSRKMMVSGKEK